VAHIGIPLTGVVESGHLSFSASTQIRNVSPEIYRDSASRTGAHFPKFATLRGRASFRELRKVMGGSKPLMRVPHGDLKSPTRINPAHSGDFKSAALVARLDSASVSLPEKKPAARHAPARADRPFKGIALILSSTVFLGVSDVTAKYLSATLPSIEIAWLRFLVFAMIMVPAMVPGSPLFALKTHSIPLQLMRGAALLGSSLFFISGLRFLPIAEASATGFVSPLFVTALSIIFLSEKVGVRRWLATAVGLLGVLVILRPGSSAFHPAAFFPLVSALAWAATLIMTRMMSGREHAITIMTYSSIAGLAILCALVPFVWVAPSWNDVALGVLIGVFSTAGQWIVVLAFRYADASVLAPFSYTQLVWVSILGFMVFGELPDVWTVVGAAFIVGSGLYTAHRERVRRSQLLEAAGEPSPNP
jgi:drug/metabolite transporter (DMT)-like permease